jgi:predicted nucleic acid-binding protein
MNYLLDTNVVSEWAKPLPNSGVVEWLAQAEEDALFLSVCAVAELRFGVASLPKGKRRDRLDEWLSSDLLARFDGRIIPVDMAIASAWGELGAVARRRGRPIDVMDGLIAATAEVYEMTVVTRDVRDFDATGVAVFDPWARR